ncbi:MAG: hypothetical protein GC200_11480 [Tepidisphaera sp.]|nr:hypothetical protein [Tepidisphaera sp.]
MSNQFRGVSTCVFIAISAAISPLAPAQPCGLRADFGPGVTGLPPNYVPSPPTINSLAVHDDGSGPALYLCGYAFSFGQADPAGVSHSVGRIRGMTAESVGYRTDGVALAAASLDLQSNLPGGPRLYVTGPGFAARNAGGGAITNIAMWDGQQWNSVGTLAPPGRALAVFDDGHGGGTQLYVAGDPLDPSGSLVSRWNGVAWEVLPPPAPSGTNVVGRALTVFDDGSGPALYLAGAFGATDSDLSGLAKWNGQGWEVLHAPATGASLSSLAVFQNKLYVAGSFSLPEPGKGGIAARNPDGTWSGIGASTQTFGILLPTLSVASDANGLALYIGNLAWMPNGVGSASVSGCFLRYDGSSVTSPVRTYWSLSSSNGAGRGYCVAAYNAGDAPSLYLAGNFSAYSTGTPQTLPLTSAAYSIVRIPQSGRQAGHILELGTGVNTGIFLTGEFNNNRPNMLKVRFQGRDQLAFFGGIGGGGGEPSFGYVLFDGEHWTTNPQRVQGTSAGPLFVAGVPAQVDGEERMLLASTESSSLGYIIPGSTMFTAYGPSVFGASQARSLQFFDDGTTNGPVLYMSGTSRISRLINGFWRDLPTTHSTNSMLIGDLGDGQRLYAGVLDFGAAGVSVWNGSDLVLMGTPGELPAGPTTLVIHDDGLGPRLYATFPGAGQSQGRTLNRIAVLEGQHWQPLGEGLVGGTSIIALASFDDGSGPSLYAAGDFTAAGSTPSKGFARWHNNAWEPVLDINNRNDGTHYYDFSLATLGDCLYVFGRFATTGLRPAGAPIDISSNAILGENLIAIRRCPPACFPDLNCDGAVDQGDVDYLINAVSGGDNPAGANLDLNSDDVVDQADVDELVNVIAGAPCQ